MKPLALLTALALSTVSLLTVEATALSPNDDAGPPIDGFRCAGLDFASNIQNSDCLSSFRIFTYLMADGDCLTPSPCEFEWDFFGSYSPRCRRAFGLGIGEGQIDESGTVELQCSSYTSITFTLLGEDLGDAEFICTPCYVFPEEPVEVESDDVWIFPGD